MTAESNYSTAVYTDKTSYSNMSTNNGALHGLDRSKWVRDSDKPG